MADTASTKSFTERSKPHGGTLASTGTEPSFTWVGTLGYLKAAGSVHNDFSVRARFYGYREGLWATLDPLWPREHAYAYLNGSPSYFSDSSGKARDGQGKCKVTSLSNAPRKPITPKITWNPVEQGYDVLAVLPVDLYCNYSCEKVPPASYHCPKPQPVMFVQHISGYAKVGNMIVPEDTTENMSQCKDPIQTGDCTYRGFTIDAPGFGDGEREDVGCSFKLVAKNHKASDFPLALRWVFHTCCYFQGTEQPDSKTCKPFTIWVVAILCDSPSGVCHVASS
ncbi:hypothetical protein [Fimbriimonas ginsengisoli]|uniref:hypothetical protein n=1 Tax=Fimbriimonas ginsengisoli TaxID=1005039 RepID=UPI0011871FBA|nr:hypothetical protein [Fimbriimonas ginsengisoli]